MSIKAQLLLANASHSLSAHLSFATRRFCYRSARRLAALLIAAGCEVSNA